MDVNRLMSGAVEAHQSGRLADARAAYDRILVAFPENADALHYRGLLRHQAGEPQALDDIARAVELRPRDLGFRFNLAEVLRETGRPEESLGHYKKVIEAAPGDGDARFGLANALFELSAYTDAVHQYKAATRAIPEDPEIHNNLGNALMELGEVEAASQAYATAVQLAPDYVDAACNLAMAHESMGEPGRAREVWSKVDAGLDKVAPDAGNTAQHLVTRARVRMGLGDSIGALDLLERLQTLNDSGSAAQQDMTGELHEQVGWTWSQMHRWSDAARHYQAAIESQGPTPGLLCLMGNVLTELQRPELALDTYTDALELAPDNGAAILGAGQALQQTGRFEEAATRYREAIGINPADGAAWYQLAATRLLDEDAELDRLRSLLQRPDISPEMQVSMHFAAAEVLDRMGDHDEAFAQFKAANDLAITRKPFDAEGWVRQTDRLVEVFDREYFTTRKDTERKDSERKDNGTTSNIPVFIVGMPRSGTTLAEQILASHPAVHGAGELYELEDTVRRARAGHPDQPYPDCFEAITASEAAALGAGHVDRLKVRAPAAARIVDKMPGNFTRVGVIALLMPDAQIVHTSRGAIDTCLSCYFQNFRSLKFTSDFADIAAVYRDYRRQMEHWRDVAPINILDLRYEDMIADQETWSRKLVAHTGLEWDPACLEFHKSERPIATASIWQARQPVYSSSVARWKRYEKHLGPLIDALGPFADE